MTKFTVVMVFGAVVALVFVVNVIKLEKQQLRSLHDKTYYDDEILPAEAHFNKGFFHLQNEPPPIFRNGPGDDTVFLTRYFFHSKIYRRQFGSSANT